jgi:5'-nucleotidase
MLALILAGLVGCNGGDKAQDDSGGSDPGPARLTILHTNDWQSHMLGWGPNAEYTADITGDDATVGGLARAKTLIDEIRGASTQPVVLYDGGDFMAGTLFQLLAKSHAAELQIAQAMGYDAMVIGNHEFDWGPALLGEMIGTADAAGVEVPLLLANIATSDEVGDDPLQAHLESGRVTATRIDTLDNGITVGLFGILGDDAATITPAVSPASFTPAEEATAAAVAALEAQNVDIIIGITHNGVEPDVALADAVPGIDITVGGHSHTPLFEPQVAPESGTVIVQAGALTQYLGQLDLVQAVDGSWTVEAYTLHELDDTIPGDPEITTMVDGFLDALAAGPLAELGHSFDEPLAWIPGDVAMDACNESGLGNFVTDAFRHRMNAHTDGAPIQAAFESQGVIRDGLLAGNTGMQSFSDLFRVLPLGIGTDDVPGYSLVDFWVTPQEIAATCEVTASISPYNGCDYFIEISGVRCLLNMERSRFNRAEGVQIEVDGAYVDLDISSANTELIHVAVDSYVASLMSILEDLTYGAITITPKTADGTPHGSWTEMIFDGDPSTEGLQELKLWQALVEHAESFDDVDGDGVPELPDRYTGPEDRIEGWN